MMGYDYIPVSVETNERRRAQINDESRLNNPYTGRRVHDSFKIPYPQFCCPERVLDAVLID